MVPSRIQGFWGTSAIRSRSDWRVRRRRSNPLYSTLPRVRIVEPQKLQADVREGRDARTMREAHIPQHQGRRPQGSIEGIGSLRYQLLAPQDLGEALPACRAPRQQGGELREVLHR